MTSLCSFQGLAGWSYCGIGLLKLLGRLSMQTSSNASSEQQDLHEDDFEAKMVRWLVSRQTIYLREEDDLVEEDEVMNEDGDSGSKSFHKDNAYPATSLTSASSPDEAIEAPLELLKCAGLNGRCNKVADTCYAFWVGASLSV